MKARENIALNVNGNSVPSKDTQTISVLTVVVAITYLALHRSWNGINVEEKILSKRCMIVQMIL